MKSKVLKKLVVGLVLIGLLLVPSMGFAAATCVISKDVFGPFRVIVFNWVAHTDGAVASGTCDETTDQELGNVSGVIVGAKFEPHATNPPTDDYDVVINTVGGADILHGVGADVTDDDSLTEQWKTPFTTDGGSVVLYQENLDLVITGAGSGNAGKVKLILY